MYYIMLYFILYYISYIIYYILYIIYYLLYIINITLCHQSILNLVANIFSLIFWLL